MDTNRTATWRKAIRRIIEGITPNHPSDGRDEGGHQSSAVLLGIVLVVTRLPAHRFTRRDFLRAVLTADPAHVEGHRLASLATTDRIQSDTSVEGLR